MSREHRELIRKIHTGADLLCLLAAWASAYFILSCTGTMLDRFSVYFLPFFAFAFSVTSYLSLRKIRPDEHLKASSQRSKSSSGLWFGAFFYLEPAH